MEITADTNFNVSVHIETKSDYGYLSASDYPLLNVSSLLIKISCTFLLIHFSVLWDHVFGIFWTWCSLANCFISQLSRSIENSVLDCNRNINRNA